MLLIPSTSMQHYNVFLQRLNFGSLAGAMKTSDKQKAALERLKRRTVFDFEVGTLFFDPKYGP